MTQAPDGVTQIGGGVATRHEKPTVETGDGDPTINWGTEIAVEDNVASVTYTQAAQDENAQFVVGNTPGVSLPATGGSGTTVFTIAGAGLILLALLGLILLNKKRGEGAGIR